jgi:hypothetical protein
MKLSEERVQREMLELTQDLVTLLGARYPRLHNALLALSEEELIDLMVELCDVFDLYKDLTAEVAQAYAEHRRSTGSLEDRDWPEN